MLMQLFVLWAIAAATPPSHLYSERSVIKPDGRPTVIRCFAQVEWLPFEGTRWWVEVDGRFHRLDTFGFESNNGPLYQSPAGDQVIAFHTFRNIIDGGLCFDLVTGEVTEVRGGPAPFEANGWKHREWRRADEAR